MSKENGWKDHNSRLQSKLCGVMTFITCYVSGIHSSYAIIHKNFPHAAEDHIKFLCKFWSCMRFTKNKLASTTKYSDKKED